MAIGLRPGLSFCEASGHLVFLDIDADRYFGLAPPAEARFRSLLGDAEGVSGLIDEFLACGILVDGQAAEPLAPATAPEVPAASLLEQPSKRASRRLVAVALRELLRARAQLRFAGFAATLRALARGKARPQSQASDPALIEASAAAFAHCALLLRSHDQCLARSVALARWLAAHGGAADLVLGVRVRPFAAHAWVQSGDRLLNETCDGIRGYTPILVI